MKGFVLLGASSWSTKLLLDLAVHLGKMQPTFPHREKKKHIDLSYDHNIIFEF